MQDFIRYDYNITIKQLENTQKTVDNIIVIINGEYYSLIQEANTEKKNND